MCLLSVRSVEGNNAPGEDFSREKEGKRWGLTLLAIDTLTIGREEEEGGYWNWYGRQERRCQDCKVGVGIQRDEIKKKALNVVSTCVRLLHINFENFGKFSLFPYPPLHTLYPYIGVYVPFIRFPCAPRRRRERGGR